MVDTRDLVSKPEVSVSTLPDSPAYNTRSRSKKKGDGITSKTFFISSDPHEILKRVNVLVASYRLGHSNVIEELTSLLDELLKLKKITKRQYLEFLS